MIIGMEILNMPNEQGKQTVGVKPPLGIKPRKIRDTERLIEIADAMHRYMIADKSFPIDWTDELEDIIWRYTEG